MTNEQWNKGIEYLSDCGIGGYIEFDDKEVFVVDMTAGRFLCYCNDEFIKLVETPVEAMLFLKDYIMERSFGY